MKLIILFFLLFSNKQDTLKLNDCYDKVYEKYPNSYSKTLYQSGTQLKLKNLDVNFLPQITLRGQATYQSDVTELLISSPLFKLPEQNKDRYQFLLDVKQTIYDGGTTSSLKNVEESQLSADKQKIEVELFSLKQRVNDLYFSVLLLQEKRNISYVFLKDIDNRITEMNSKVENGIIPKSNIYILEAQKIQTEQEILNINSDIESSLNMLGQLMEFKLENSTILKTPNPVLTNFDFNSSERPEYKLFELQSSQFGTLISTVNTKSLPKVNIFGQGGYGRPGLNMLDNTFKAFYTVGISFSWNPVNWNSNNNEIQIYEINKKVIEKQKETFEKNLNVTLEKYKSDILKFEEQLKKDEELINLRKKIVESTASQLENGTITSTVYLTELNNLSQSLLTLNTHKLQLTQAKINFLTTKGSKIYE